MLLDDERESELRELIERLDRLVPRDGAHLTVPTKPGSAGAIGNRLGYLRLGVELLAAALRPLPESNLAPPRIAPRLEYLLTERSGTPFALCELDESIVSRPPAQTRLGPVGQLVAGVLLVALVVLLLIGLAVVWRWALW